MLETWQVILLAGTVLALLALWVRREHGGRAALVMLGLSAAALASLWVAYEVIPVEQWRKESLPVGLAIFALPAIAGTVLAVLKARSDGTRLRPADALYLILLWATPAVLLYVSQRKPFGSELADLLWWAASSLAIYTLVPVARPRLSNSV